MTTARELMTPNAECVGEDDNLVTAASKMRDLDVGALPICGDDRQLKGVITDRDIIVKVVADGGILAASPRVSSVRASPSRSEPMTLPKRPCGRCRSTRCAGCR